MSASYTVLLQNLDDRDVKKGLGRSVQVRKRCCCQSWLMWTCISSAIILGLVISILVPLTLALPSSSWIWKQWFHSSQHLNTTNSTHSVSLPESGHSSITSVVSPLNQTNGSFHNGTTAPSSDKRQNSTGEFNNATFPHFANSTQNNSTNFFQNANDMFRQMYAWTKDTVDKIPKIPLIISLSLFGLVIVTIIWFAIYRRIVRRQRRRTLGKLVMDLQSGDKAVLLNSDDSDED